MMPRLLQPLFREEMKKARKENDAALYMIVRAYDCIWNLVHRPDDIQPDERMSNARANLYQLGDLIENALGPEVFSADPNQLTFPDEIISPTQPALMPAQTMIFGEKLD